MKSNTATEIARTLVCELADEAFAHECDGQVRLIAHGTLEPSPGHDLPLCPKHELMVRSSFDGLRGAATAIIDELLAAPSKSIMYSVTYADGTREALLYLLGGGVIDLDRTHERDGGWQAVLRASVR